MADIALRIAADFKQAEKAFKDVAKGSEFVKNKFNKMAESSKKVETAMKRNAEKNRLNAIAMRATRGATVALITETRGLEREIQRLIKSGLSPESKHVKKLQADYIRLNQQIKKTSKFKGMLISKIKMFASLGLAVGLGLITRQFLKFDQAIISASAKFTELNRNTEEGRKTIEELGKTARKVGAETQFSADQAAEGLNFLAMAGFSAVQSMKLLPGVVDLATVANIDLARATDIASDAIGAFGLMTDDATQLSINFARIQDVMAATIVSTNTDMEQLFETMKFAGPAFTTAGQSIESFSAIAGRMAANGIKASQAGTSLRTGIIRLAAAPADAKKALKSLNISVADTFGNMRPIIDIIKELSTKTKNMGNVQKSAALAAIFGKKAFSGWAAILNEGTEKTEALHKSLLKANGKSKEMAEIIRGSLTNQLKTLLSTITELGFVFIDAFAKQGASAIKGITEAFRMFTPVVEVLAKSLSFVLKIMPPLVLTFLAYKIGVIAALVQTKIFALAQVASAGASVIYTAAVASAAAGTGFFTGAVKALTLAMKLNPIGLIAVAVAALAVGIVALIKNWDLVKFKVVDFATTANIKMLEFALTIRQKVMGATNAMINQFSKIPFVGKHFKAIKKETDKTAQSLKYLIFLDKKMKLAATEKYLASLKASKASKKEAEAAALAAKAKIKGIDAVTAARKKSGKTQEELDKEEAARFKQKMNNISSFIGQIANISNAVGSLASAIYQKSLNALDRKMQKELKAAGVLEKTQVEQAQRELDAAKATGDALDIEEKRRALIKAQIDEKYFKQRQRLEFKAALTAWKFQVAAATAQVAMTILTAMGSGWKLGPLGAGTYAALAGAASGVQAASVYASKPTAPSAETGLTNFTVPEIRATRNDGAAVMVQGGEQVDVTPRGESRNRDVNVDIKIGEQVLFRVIQKGIDDGRLKFNNKNIGRSVFAT